MSAVCKKKKFELYQASSNVLQTHMHTVCKDNLILFLFLSHSLSLFVSVSVRLDWRLIVLQEMLSPYRLQDCIL